MSAAFHSEEYKQDVSLDHLIRSQGTRSTFGTTIFTFSLY